MLPTLLRTVLSALLSLVVLFVFTRLMGARQISQMSLFDYINGITIGSIAAEVALSGLDADTLYGAAAMAVYALGALGVSVLCNKSIRARRILVGKPTVLLDHGRLFEENLMKAKLDVNEFLTACRVAGYFDLADLETAVLEPNGSISFLPKAEARPFTPADAGRTPAQDKPVHNVVIDGRVLPDCLRETGNNDAWLANELRRQKVRLADLILATCDKDNKLTVYVKTGRTEPRNLFL